VPDKLREQYAWVVAQLQVSDNMLDHYLLRLRSRVRRWPLGCALLT
jgi:hypothetical protein